MNDLRRELLRTLLLSGAALLALVPNATMGGDEVEKAFRISGEGVGTEGLPLPGQPPRPHWIVGNATHLGLHYGEGAVRTDSAVPTFDDDGNLTGFAGEFGSGAPFVFCAADGDKLVCNYGRADLGASEPGSFVLSLVNVLPGPLFVVEASWIAEFVPDGEASTGRFAGASGSWIMYAFSEPFVLGSDDPVNYWWEGEGRLTFEK